jgi:hypothetical protein
MEIRRSLQVQALGPARHSRVVIPLSSVEEFTPCSKDCFVRGCCLREQGALDAGFISSP